MGFNLHLYLNFKDTPTQKMTSKKEFLPVNALFGDHIDNITKKKMFQGTFGMPTFLSGDFGEFFVANLKHNDAPYQTTDFVQNLSDKMTKKEFQTALAKNLYSSDEKTQELTLNGEIGYSSSRMCVENYMLAVVAILVYFIYTIIASKTRKANVFGSKPLSSFFLSAFMPLLFFQLALWSVANMVHMLTFQSVAKSMDEVIQAQKNSMPPHNLEISKEDNAKMYQDLWSSCQSWAMGNQFVIGAVGFKTIWVGFGGMFFYASIKNAKRMITEGSYEKLIVVGAALAFFGMMINNLVRLVFNTTNYITLSNLVDVYPGFRDVAKAYKFDMGSDFDKINDYTVEDIKSKVFFNYLACIPDLVVFLMGVCTAASMSSGSPDTDGLPQHVHHHHHHHGQAQGQGQQGDAQSQQHQQQAQQNVTNNINFQPFQQYGSDQDAQFQNQQGEGQGYQGQQQQNYGATAY